MQSSVDMVYSMVTIYMQINVLEDQEEDISKPRAKIQEKSHNDDKMINSEYLIYA